MVKYTHTMLFKLYLLFGKIRKLLKGSHCVCVIKANLIGPYYRRKFLTAADATYLSLHWPTPITCKKPFQARIIWDQVLFWCVSWNWVCGVKAREQIIHEKQCRNQRRRDQEWVTLYRVTESHFTVPSVQPPPAVSVEKAFMLLTETHLWTSTLGSAMEGHVRGGFVIFFSQWKKCCQRGLRFSHWVSMKQGALST